MPHLALTEHRRSILRLGVAACLAACVLAWAVPARAEGGFELKQLTALLSTVRSSEATFTEKRVVSILAQTLESSGRLSFSAPDTFVRETLKPRQEKVAVVGNMVTLSAGGRTRTVPLDSVPEAAVIMEAIRGTLTGNREVLERHFRATVLGDPQRWALKLVPLESKLLELVSWVELTGQRSLVSEVTVAMADGDRSVMRIETLAVASKAASSASN